MRPVKMKMARHLHLAFPLGLWCRAHRSGVQLPFSSLRAFPGRRALAQGILAALVDCRDYLLRLLTVHADPLSEYLNVIPNRLIQRRDDPD